MRNWCGRTSPVDDIEVVQTALKCCHVYSSLLGSENTQRRPQLYCSPPSTDQTSLLLQLTERCVPQVVVSLLVVKPSWEAQLCCMSPTASLAQQEY